MHDDTTEIINKPERDLRNEALIRKKLDNHMAACPGNKSWLKANLMLFVFGVLPFSIMFWVFISQVNTRLTVLEKTVPSKIELREVVQDGMTNSLTRIIEQIEKNREDIIEIKLGYKDIK